VKAETMLFRVRYSNEDPKERQGFINSLPFGGDRVSDGDKIQLKTPLMAATPSLRSDADFEAEVFYRVSHRFRLVLGIDLPAIPHIVIFQVPWTKVIDLVATRRVFLRAGYAFVPSTLQSSIINQEFSSRLTIALETTARHVPTLDEEDRLFPILEQFSSAFLAGVSGESAGGFNEAAGVGDVTKDMIDELSRRHFPVCMRHLHNSLRRDQHLKHWGRLQYVLFLKVGIEAYDRWIAPYDHSFAPWIRRLWDYP
jgi:DNA primase large subunit